jgi:two-component system OmpR family sensor kinase
VRIALIFTAAMAPVLAITGILLYQRFGSDLDGTINSGLRSRAADVRALIGQSASGLREGRLKDETESFAEIIERDGRLLDSTAQLRGRVLLDAAERRRAAKTAVFLDRPANATFHDQSRLLAVPVRSNGRPMIAVVGTSTETRADSLSDLLGVLLLGGPIALLLAAVAAYGGAGAALRPVDAMRARAAQISEAAPEERLPVPPAQDEIGRLGDTLNRMLERLGQTLAHERRFVADASHELRTPLAILKTELELALGEGRTREELRDALTSAAEETDRLIELAEDLLLLAQTDRGRLPVALEPAPVAPMLGDLVERFALRARETDREIQIVCADELYGRFDRPRLEQALGNLLDNSLRYGAGPIELRAEPREGRMEIHVADRGQGFPAGFTELAFERFSRPAGARATSGAGLGMAIVASIARAHGGSAHAAGRPGGGADVWLDLPGPMGAPLRPGKPTHAL